MMRIVFVTHCYWTAVGGVEKYIHRLCLALHEMGHQVCVVAGAHVEGLPDAETHEGIRVRRYPAYRSSARAWWHLMRMRNVFLEADVIHISDTLMLEYFYRMVAWTIPRKPLFLTRHGMSYIHPVPELEKARAIRTLDLADGIVHDGCFIAKRLGVEPDLCPDQGLSPPADALPAVPEPPPTSAIYIGRLEPDSGIHTYIDAVRQLTGEQGREFTLHLYGDGSLMPEVRAVVARDGLPVRIHGRTPDAQRHIVDFCFAFIDGRMAIQEAMARRRLVLAAYVDPLKRDYIGAEPFSPYLIGVADGAELAARVTCYIDHPDQRGAMVARAFEHARTLTWARTAQAYLRLWQERLRSARPHLSPLASTRLAWTLEREARSPKPQSPPQVLRSSNAAFEPQQACALP